MSTTSIGTNELPHASNIATPTRSGANITQTAFGGAINSYIERNGISTEGVIDAASVAVEGALANVDRMDGKQDGVIHRSSLSKLVQPYANMLAASKAEPKAGIDMAAVRKLVAQMPESFPVPQAKEVEAGVRTAVTFADRDHDERLSKAELETLQKGAQAALNSLGVIASELATHGPDGAAAQVPTVKQKSLELSK